MKVRDRRTDAFMPEGGADQLLPGELLDIEEADSRGLLARHGGVAPEQFAKCFHLEQDICADGRPLALRDHP